MRLSNFGENRGCCLAFGRLKDSFDSFDSRRLGASHRVPLKERTLEKAMISAPIIGYLCLIRAYGLQGGGRSRAKEEGRDDSKPFEEEGTMLGV